MEGQIRPLHTVHHRRRARVPLAPVELRLAPDDGRRDVPDGLPLLLLLARVAFGVVRRQGVGAGEVEGAPALRPRGRGGADVDFLRGDGAVVADLPGGDAEGFLAEHVALFLDSFEIS